MSQQVQAILAGLEAAAATLAAGDASRGAEFLEQVQIACDVMATHKETFAPDELERARELHNLCLATAARVGPTLLASLLQSATLRRATNAYGSEG